MLWQLSPAHQVEGKYFGKKKKKKKEKSELRGPTSEGCGCRGGETKGTRERTPESPRLDRLDLPPSMLILLLL